jgi:hypothetical protein
VSAHLLLLQGRQYLKLISKQSLRSADLRHRYVEHQLSHVLREALTSSMYDDYPIRTEYSPFLPINEVNFWWNVLPALSV